MACLVLIWPLARELRRIVSRFKLKKEALKVTSHTHTHTEGPPACVWLEGMKPCAGKGTSVPLRASLPSPPVTTQDTCCVDWQVGSWGSWSRLQELEPLGQIHITPYNPWQCVCFLQSFKVARQRLPLCKTVTLHPIRIKVIVFTVRVRPEGLDSEGRRAQCCTDTNARHTQQQMWREDLKLKSLNPPLFYQTM